MSLLAPSVTGSEQSRYKHDNWRKYISNSSNKNFSAQHIFTHEISCEDKALPLILSPKVRLLYPHTHHSPLHSTMCSDEMLPQVLMVG